MATIAVDFDHTLVDGETPIKGAREAINILREHGHKIIIHSCNGPKWIERVMNNNDMRFDYIWGSEGSDSGQKPVASLYIDDRGYRFEGWDGDELERILNLARE